MPSGHLYPLRRRRVRIRFTVLEEHRIRLGHSRRLPLLLPLLLIIIIITSSSSNNNNDTRKTNPGNTARDTLVSRGRDRRRCTFRHLLPNRSRHSNTASTVRQRSFLRLPRPRAPRTRPLLLRRRRRITRVKEEDPVRARWITTLRRQVLPLSILCTRSLIGIVNIKGEKQEKRDSIMLLLPPSTRSKNLSTITRVPSSLILLALRLRQT